jgi:hypothetical protein
MSVHIVTQLLDLVVVIMDKIGLGIGIVGGLGLGMLVGSELSGSTITLIGAGLVVISLIAMIVFSLRK